MNELDELDAYIQSLAPSATQPASAAAATTTTSTATQSKDQKNDLELDDDDDDLFISESSSQPLPTIKTALDIIQEKAKKKEILPVAHGLIPYGAFRKNFYLCAPDLERFTNEQVQTLLLKLDIKVRGRKPPRPIERWEQCGVSGALLDTLKVQGWDVPFAVQRQVVPGIMAGRDVVCVAETGSGKTLAYLVPLVRHVLDQEVPRQGCIGLVITPTRELATQIHDEVEKFKGLGVTSACLYGGSNVGNQIATVRRGVHVVVGTPGRLIDVLASRGGRNLPLTRVTFVVLDEADRLFDMGFEPQIERILANVRPDRQMAMFSATFPQHVERIARSSLSGHPLHITVGTGTGKVSATVDQTVELRNTEQQRYARLLQLLGEWYPKGCCILVFCDSQVHVDAIFQNLERDGYSSLSLHAGKDQADRDSAISDFKNKTRTVMVATGVAGRGLDVAELDLVINYNCPNHLEEYVHRVGRTGRAGRRGTAITFVGEDDAKYAGDLIVALKSADIPVPSFLENMYTEFKAKVDAGTARKHISGYRTKGFSFNPEEDTTGYAAQAKRVKTEHIRSARGNFTNEEEAEDDNDDDEEEENGDNHEEEDEEKKERRKKGNGAGTAKELFSDPSRFNVASNEKKEFVGIVSPFAQMVPSNSSATAATTTTTTNTSSSMQIIAKGAAPLPHQGLPVVPIAALTEAERRLVARASKDAPAVAAMALPPIKDRNATSAYPIEIIEINDLPDFVRMKITAKRAMTMIENEFRVSLTKRGNFIAPGRAPNMGEFKLQLVVEAPNPIAVRRAAAEINRRIQEEASRLTVDQAVEHVTGFGRYRV